MTSYQFEIVAKNAVIDMLAEHGITLKISDLQLVWFAHIIGSKKCLIWAPAMRNKYAEVTYSLETDMLYVDLYEKIQHKELHSFEMADEVRL